MSVTFQSYEILSAFKLNAALQEEIANRLTSDAAETAARSNADALEILARNAAIAVETAARGGAVTAETAARISAVSVETSARIAGDIAEASARAAAIIAGRSITANPSIAIAPVGNGFATLGAFAQTGTTTSTTLREFAGSFGLESYTGYGGVGAFGIRADKVTLYSGIEGFANSADIWAFNTVTRMATGFPALSNALGYELDFNNEVGARGGTQGLAGFGGAKAGGLLITGASTFSSTAAIEVGGASNTQWYRGIGITGGCSQASFYDYGTGTSGIEMQATHAWGIDMLYSALGGAMRMPNNSGLYARNAGNTADYAVINVDNVGNMEIGVTSGGTNNVAGIYTGAGILPIVDIAYSLGSGTKRWGTLYANTGTINTSDPRDKTAMQPLPDVGAIIDAVTPISYKWKVGGQTFEDVTEDRMVQATEQETYESFEIEVNGGRAVRKTVTKTRLRDVYDDVPLLGMDGQPLITHVPARPFQAATFNGDGSVATPEIKARKAADIPQTHRVPRMVKKWVTVQKQVDQPGKRTHGGFSADDFEKIADALGLDDYAAYVVDETGRKALRDNEISPIIWRELQSLRAREKVKDAVIASLVADVAALKAAAQPHVG